MNARTDTADIVVIGGGILGICTAYYLLQHSNLKVVVCEKDLLAQAATGLCVGGIRQQFSHPANIRLSQETLQILEESRDEWGAALDFHKIGYLFLTKDPATWENFLGNVEVQLRWNVPVEALSPQEIHHRWPYLRTDDLLGGTFCADDGYVDPYDVAMAFSRAARKEGAVFLEKTEVLDIELKSDRVQAVITTQGRLATPVVINAAGAWATQVACMSGLNLPIKPYRRQVYVTTAFDAIPRPIPLVIDQDSLFYFREDGPGILMGKTDAAEPSSFNTHTDREFLETLIETASYRAPRLAEAEILRGWGGLYAITPDENPIIGALSDHQGLYGAIGFSGHGFQHGPAVGRALSRMVLEGKVDLDLSAFRYDRFDRLEDTGEKITV
ncbi:MAG: FAD-dependent oxidoreductase [Candidatus Aminicenantes bacterium]|nr:FAD-dependent oxidoreductase [Candidatus Aminicenantes bacterium]